MTRTRDFERHPRQYMTSSPESQYTSASSEDEGDRRAGPDIARDRYHRHHSPAPSDSGEQSDDYEPDELEDAKRYRGKEGRYHESSYHGMNDRDGSRDDCRWTRAFATIRSPTD